MEIRVVNLSVARGGVPLLQALSLRLRPGQVLVLRGPNGCGKTTLLRTLAGLQPPLDGAIYLPPDATAYGAHADGLKATLSVQENLEFWAAIYRGADNATAAVASAMARMDLAGLAERPAHHLSAGQKRRLGLARLLIADRPIWILDEPTVSLDAASVALFSGVLRDHLAAGGMALIATHIDLGLPEAEVLDLAPYKSRRPALGQGSAFDEAFL